MQFELYHYPCCLCGSTKHKVLYPAQIQDDKIFDPACFQQSYANNSTLRIVRCTNCGFIFNDPRETPEGLAYIYSQVEDEDYINELPGKLANFKRNLDFIETYKQQGTLIDVGCGHGYFLGLADPQRWQRLGIEPSTDAADEARNTYNVDVFAGTLDQAPIPAQSADVITLLHVIEHVFNPLELLQQASKLLRPDGIIYIETPDIGSGFARLLGRKWWYIMRFHTHYFTVRTLTLACRKVGLEVESIIRPPKTWSLGYLIWRLGGYFPRSAWSLGYFPRTARLILPIVKKLNLFKVLMTFKISDQIGLLARKPSSHA